MRLLALLQVLGQHTQHILELELGALLLADGGSAVTHTTEVDLQAVVEVVLHHRGLSRDVAGVALVPVLD